MILNDPDSIIALIIIFSITGLASFASRSAGLIAGVILTFVAWFLAFALATVGAGKYFVQMAAIFPAATWLAFWAGRRLRA